MENYIETYKKQFTQRIDMIHTKDVNNFGRIYYNYY